MRQQRELTEKEQRIVNLCKRFEEALAQKHVSVSLWAKDEMAVALRKAELEHGKFRILSYQFDKARKQHRVTWELPEFHRYLIWAMDIVGMKLMLDGSLRTSDGLTITQEYLQ
jgi:hypothetical protein